LELVVLQDGRERQVTVVEDAPAWRFSVDGRTYRVNFARLRNNLRSLIIDGHQTELSLRVKGRSDYLVSSPHRTDWVEVLEPLEYAAREANPAQADPGLGLVTAYMPGRVVAILVRPEQTVSAGQGLVVLEAMKMENEIKAGRDGVVGEIFVDVGDAVEAGDRLVEVR
jgi:pyruvate carboxylase subunit B